MILPGSQRNIKKNCTSFLECNSRFNSVQYKSKFMPFKNGLYALACTLIGLMEMIPVFSQFPAEVNYIESRVLPYTLPDPLKMPNGQMVKNKIEWIKVQRPYIYHLFENNVYGR